MVAKTHLEPGEIQFFDNFLPKLAAGTYEISVKTTTNIPLEEKEKEKGKIEKIIFNREQELIIESDPFRMGIEDIHSVYPPANARGEFKNTLPNIVLRKRSFPWERDIFNDNTLPWVALLVLEEDELLEDILVENELEDGVLEIKDRTSTGAYVRPIKELKEPGDKFVKPDLSHLPNEPTDEEQQKINKKEDNEKAPKITSCQTIDITWETFKAIVPRKEELKYLTHVRAVNTGDKELLGMHADGWFSVVVANRFPKPMDESEKDKPVEERKHARNIVHLVSLEGFQEYLIESKMPRDNKKVRLASLASWQFYDFSAKEDFCTLVKGLNKTEDTEEEKNQLLKMPFEMNNVETGVKSYLSEVISGGYVPLQYNMRLGEKTMAWYRGPLTPVMTEDLKLPIAFSAESNLAYDEDKGLFDVSYSVAWQIGRLMALSDKYFSSNILRWKQRAHQLENKMNDRKGVEKTFALTNTIKKLNEKHDLEGILNDELPNQLINEFLIEELLPLAKELAPLIKETDIGNDEMRKKIVEMDSDLARELFNKIKKQFEY